MHIVTHQIAGITFRTESDVRLRHLENDSFKEFRIDDVKPDVCQRIQQFDPNSSTLSCLDPQERERLCSSIGFQQRWLDNSILRVPEIRTRLRGCLDLPERVNIEIAGKEVIIRDFARCEFDIFYPPHIKGYFTGPGVRAGFRNVLSTFLTSFSAVMIHGSGVIYNGRATLFLAPDGGGKTAVVQRLSRLSVLNDDQIILRAENNVVIAHATPLGPITGGPQRAQIGALLLLEKASGFELVRAKPRDILQFLWNEHMHRWGVLPKDLRLRAFEVLYEACHQAPVYRMLFKKDYVDWDALDAAVVR